MENHPAAQDDATLLCTRQMSNGMLIDLAYGLKFREVTDKPGVNHAVRGEALKHRHSAY